MEKNLEVQGFESAKAYCSDRMLVGISVFKEQTWLKYRGDRNLSEKLLGRQTFKSINCEQITID